VITPGDERPDPKRRVLPLSLVVDPPDDLALMQDEIFGPILPIKPYDSLDEAIAYINAHERPLALYVFTDDEAVADRVLARTTRAVRASTQSPFTPVCPAYPSAGLVKRDGMPPRVRRLQTFSHARAVYRRGPVNPWEVMPPPWGEMLGMVARSMTGG